VPKGCLNSNSIYIHRTYTVNLVISLPKTPYIHRIAGPFPAKNVVYDRILVIPCQKVLNYSVYKTLCITHVLVQSASWTLYHTMPTECAHGYRIYICAHGYRMRTWLHNIYIYIYIYMRTWLHNIYMRTWLHNTYIYIYIIAHMPTECAPPSSSINK
jgi:hypothetical protein